MPPRNSVKNYAENSFYHIYNRGVEKRVIFQDKQDYSVFLNYLKTYLLPKDVNSLQKLLMNNNASAKDKAQAVKLLRMNNFNSEIRLLAFCLMPNHFHLLIQQKSSVSMDLFMNSFSTRYVMYFNQKYKRVGPLFQGVYKAVLVETNPQLLYLTSYIHRNPLSLLNLKGDPLQAQPSSYRDYLGQSKTNWLDTNEILSFFSKNNPKLDYRLFVQQTNDFTIIKNLTLEVD